MIKETEPKFNYSAYHWTVPVTILGRWDELINIPGEHMIPGETVRVWRYTVRTHDGVVRDVPEYALWSSPTKNPFLYDFS